MLAKPTIEEICIEIECVSTTLHDISDYRIFCHIVSTGHRIREALCQVMTVRTKVFRPITRCGIDICRQTCISEQIELTPNKSGLHLFGYETV